MENKILEIKNLSKSFVEENKKINVLDNISFDVYNGEILSIVGTSGCGKSTLLNILSNLDNEYDGEVIYNFDKKHIGYMLQDPSLFPWYNIEKNANLSCEVKGIDNKKYISELLKRYGIEDFKNNYPDKLSGGMKQRVALIRTISAKPNLLLLDEPFAALDYQSRLSISNDVYNLVKENNLTAILITHDISEAISMSDRIIVLSKRPSSIKKVYNVELERKIDPISNRKDKRFSYYYEMIGKDLDLF